MKKIVLLATCLLVASSAVATPAAAGSLDRESLTENAPSDAPDYDPTVPEPGPGDITWDEAAKIPEGEAGFSEGSTQSGVSPQAAPRTKCSIDTRNVYLRTSGKKKFPYGTVGGKPTTKCSVPMVSIKQTTTLYKTVWWGMQKVGGPWTSKNNGVSSLTQKNVERKCDDRRKTTFRMVVRSTGKFPHGPTGTASAYEIGEDLRCGTKP